MQAEKRRHTWKSAVIESGAIGWVGLGALVVAILVFALNSTGSNTNMADNKPAATQTTR
ncbi:MAG: hypothetical protein HY056_15300 [Proteobacteria bacterium]|nr:hypothetical protein [Pseudomonadota bacterium]